MQHLNDIERLVREHTNTDFSALTRDELDTIQRKIHNLLTTSKNSLNINIAYMMGINGKKPNELANI